MAFSPELLDRFKEFEGNVPYMYLDSRGNVTVGVGLMLPDQATAIQLPFFDGSTLDPATDGQKSTDWNNVKEMPTGHTAPYYQNATIVRLPQNTIDDLLVSTLNAFEQQLRTQFGQYPTFPTAAQEGLLDMIYTLGLGGLRKFVKFCAAVVNQDWDTASGECFRNGVQPSRNAAIKQLFLNAAM